MGLLNDLFGGLNRADKDQLNRIEGALKTMAIDFTNLDQKVSDVSAAIASGFAAVGQEVTETAQLVKDLRDKINTGGLDEATIQAHLDSIVTALDGAAATATAKAADVAASLDVIQNPPTTVPAPTE